MTGKIKAGIEARKNRLRRRVIGGIGEFVGASLLIFAMASLTSGFIYTYCYILSSPYFEIRETSVRGLKELTEKDILKLAEIKPAQNILAINTDVVAERIAKNSWVKNVYVGREMPDRLVVEVRERNPVALLKHGAEFYLMDTAGVVFKKYSMDDELDLPIITSAHVQDHNKSRLLSDTLLLLKALSDSKQYAFLGAISEVQVDELFGLSLLTDKGLHLKLGRDDFEAKLQQLPVVLADAEKRGMRNGRLSIDMVDISKITLQPKNVLGWGDQTKKGKEYKI